MTPDGSVSFFIINIKAKQKERMMKVTIDVALFTKITSYLCNVCSPPSVIFLFLYGRQKTDPLEGSAFKSSVQRAVLASRFHQYETAVFIPACREIVVRLDAGFFL